MTYSRTHSFARSEIESLRDPDSDLRGFGLATGFVLPVNHARERLNRNSSGDPVLRQGYAIRLTGFSRKPLGLLTNLGAEQGLPFGKGLCSFHVNSYLPTPIHLNFLAGKRLRFRPHPSIPNRSQLSMRDVETTGDSERLRHPDWNWGWLSSSESQAVPPDSTLMTGRTPKQTRASTPYAAKSRR